MDKVEFIIDPLLSVPSGKEREVGEVIQQLYYIKQMI